MAQADLQRSDTLHAQGHLILMAAPPVSSSYYKALTPKIIDFQVTLAKQIRPPDEVIILTNREFYQTYVTALGGPERVRHALPHPLEDIWIRDFGPVHPDPAVILRYTAAGQGGEGPWLEDGQADADAVQAGFLNYLDRIEWGYERSGLLLDGGNFVFDGRDMAVVSRKFLDDNDMDEAEARRALRDATGYDHIAFIDTHEDDFLAHSDGMVAFLQPGLLAYNAMPENPEAEAELRDDLENALPGVQLVALPAPHDNSEMIDPLFGSACGLYVNALVTPFHIYLPQYGKPEDREAIAIIQEVTPKPVIPVDASGVCPMGGSVRCMTTQFLR